MNGLAITAGSNPICLAIIGSEHPIILAIKTVTIRVRHTTTATTKSILSKNVSLARLHTANVPPHINATLASFHNTLKMSLKSISSSDNALITVTDD